MRKFVIPYRPTTIGDFEYIVEVPVLPDEARPTTTGKSDWSAFARIRFAYCFASLSELRVSLLEAPAGAAI